MKIFHQLTQSECGLACVASLLSAYGPAPGLKQLRRHYETGRDGMTVRDMAALIRELGYEPKALRVSGEGYRDVPVPFIAYWRQSHYVVVRRIGRGWVDLVDPATHRRRVSAEEFRSDFSGLAISVTSGPEPRPAPDPEKSPWWAVLPFVRRARRWLLLLLSTTGVSLAVTLLTPAILASLVDSVTAGRPGLGATLGWLLVASVVGYLASGLVSALVGVKAALHIGRDLENAVFGHLLRLPFKYFTQRSRGDLLYRLTSVKDLRSLLTNDLVSGISAIVLVAVISVVMLVMSWQLWVLASALFLLTSLVLVATRGTLTRWADRELQCATIGSGIQVDAVGTISLVKSTGTEEHFTRAWIKANDDTLRWSWRRTALESVVQNLVGFTQSLGPLLITVVAVSGVTGNQLSLGQILGFQVLSAVFFGQTTVVSRVTVRAAEGRAMVERVEDVLVHPPDTVFDGGTVTDVTPEIVVSNVTFAYTNRSRPVLQDVSVHIPAGAKVAIVGASGSGKSTLARIIAGLYAPSKGEVRFGSVPLGHHVRESFRNQVAYVEQDAPLQNRSIRENIAWGVEVDADRVVAAARKAQIHHEVESMPMKYETLITNLGENISGGQRQRIVLARALVRSPRVLILDESTSSLDLDNEGAFYRVLARESMTRVVIAHRLDTIKDADLIIVMADGRVAEQGDHDSLMRAGGTYASLYRAGHGTLPALEPA